MIQMDVQRLIAMGPLPDSVSAIADVARIDEYQRFLGGVTSPVTNEEALALARLFGPDDCFGLAWTLVHLIESAPDWPLVEAISGGDSEWLQLLRERSERGTS